MCIIEYTKRRMSFFEYNRICRNSQVAEYNMRKKTIIILSVLLCFMLTSCSTVNDLLAEAGIDDLKDKFDAAWSEVGKDAMGNLVDDIWREYGLGRSLNWPENGNGALIPKLRGGDYEDSFVSDDGKSGCIILNGVSFDEYEAYEETLAGLGFRQSLTITELDAIYSCDGLYCGFMPEEELFYIVYGETVDELNEVYAAVMNDQEE